MKVTSGIVILLVTTISAFANLCGCGGGGGGGVTVTISPEDAATDVALDAAITAIASSALDPDTITTSSMTVKPASSTDGISTACTSVTYDSSTKTAVCAHGDLAPGVLYTMTVTTDVKDASGNALASPAQASFTTTSTAGSNTPIPKLVIPSVNAAGINTIEISFDKDVDAVMATSTGNFSVTAGTDSTNLVSSVSYNTANRTSTLALSSTITCSGDSPTKYPVVVTSDIRSATGFHAVKPLSEYFTNWDDNFKDSTTVAYDVNACWIANHGQEGGVDVEGEVVDSNTTNPGKATIRGSPGHDVTNDNMPGLIKANKSPGAFGMTIKFDTLTGMTGDNENLLVMLVKFTPPDPASMVFFAPVLVGDASSSPTSAAYMTVGVLNDTPSIGDPPTLGCPTCLGTTPVFICVTRSEDGTQFTAQQDEGGTGTFTSLALPSSVPTLEDPLYALNIALGYAGVPPLQEATIDWIRFNVGEAACPSTAE